MSNTTLFKAFPLGNQVSAWQNGMDLRDYFAAKAMQLFLGQGSFNHPDAAAKTAYEYADAMMEARYDSK